MSTITILTSLYKGIEFLEEIVNSVLAQTYTDWIIFIGVKGHDSTGGAVVEHAREIVNQYCSGRIHVFV